MRSATKTDLVLDKGGKGEAVEQVGEEAPDVRVPILAQALIVETVYLSNLPRLVVPTEDGDPVRVAELERHEESDGLDRVVAAVNVVAHEQVVGIGRVSTDAEELGQVVLCRALRQMRLGAGFGGARTNWPWMSPQTVTGHRTGCTFDSCIRISRD